MIKELLPYLSEKTGHSERNIRLFLSAFQKSFYDCININKTNFTFKNIFSFLKVDMKEGKSRAENFDYIPKHRKLKITFHPKLKNFISSEKEKLK